MPQRTRKSYTDGKGNYHRGLEEELADIEAAISGGGEAAEGAASQSSATSEGTRGDVDSLRRQAALIRAEIARREQLKQEFRKKYNISEKGDISLDDLSRLFHDLNSNKAVGELFDNIRGITGSVLLITFSHSQHHSRVDVQLTTQFSAYFQRGLALAIHLI